ncbi:MAG TPA: hypothetical protein VMT45_10675 [Thermoanaerobaculaceae bacterium]|nr:hypothetical protein [Thermoanaerobaculaceae bacterium]
MRRLAVVLATIAVLAAAAALVWRWWTAPPCADAEALATAMAPTPARADGALTIAQPGRAARWLAAHPQAVLLLRLAAPAADRSLPSLQRFLVALASEARGPLTVWWRGADLAACANVKPRATSALRRLAALEGLPINVYPATGGAVSVSVGSATDLLQRGENTPQPEVERGRLAALARCRGRWWRARAGRSALELVAGDPPEVPASTGPGLIVTTDLAALVAAAAPVRWVPSAPARLVFESTGWAAELPDTPVSHEVRKLLALGGDAAADTPPGARHWRGLLGDLWALPGPGLVVSSRPDLLATLPHGTIVGEAGRIRGGDLARLLRRALAAAQGIPGSSAYTAGLQRALPVVEGLRLARWSVLPHGGHIMFEW